MPAGKQHWNKRLETVSAQEFHEIQIQLTEQPPGVMPPLNIKVEHTRDSGDLQQLKVKIEMLLREKLVFRAQVDLVPAGTLPKYEYKAQLVKVVDGHD